MESKASILLLLLLLCICFLIQTGESATTSPPSPLAKRRTFTFPFPFPQTPPFPGSHPIFPFPIPKTHPLSGEFATTFPPSPLAKRKAFTFPFPFPFPFPQTPSFPESPPLFLIPKTPVPETPPLSEEFATTFPPSPLAKRRTFTFPFPFSQLQTPLFHGSSPLFPFPLPKTPIPGTPPVSGGNPFPGSPSGPLNQEAKACLANFHNILRSSKSKHNLAKLDVTYALCHTIKELRPKCWPILFPYAPTLPPSLLANCGAPAPGPSPVNPPNLASF